MFHVCYQLKTYLYERKTKHTWLNAVQVPYLSPIGHSSALPPPTFYHILSLSYLHSSTLTSPSPLIPSFYPLHLLPLSPFYPNPTPQNMTPYFYSIPS